MADQSCIEGAIVRQESQPPNRSVPADIAWPRTRGEFAALVLAFQDRLVRFAFRRLRRRDEAEEVVQEVFLRAYARMPRNAVAHVSSYLYRMAENACTDALRKRGRNSIPLDTRQAQCIPDPRRGASDETAALQELQRVEALIARLPRRQAEVVRLRTLDELSFAEIAEVVGCSLGTVKSRFRYGIGKLRSVVKNDWEEKP